MKKNKITAGFSDVVSLVKEKNFKPFTRPLLVLLLAIAGVYFLHQSTSSQIADMKKKADAQAAEVENREEYLKNKAKYVKLIEMLPPNDQKEVWHQSQLISIKQQLELQDRAFIHKNETKKTEGVFTIPVEAEVTFEQLGKILETIENYPTFLRVSDLKINRKQGELEKLFVTFNTNTIFIQDKDFPDLKGGK